MRHRSILLLWLLLLASFSPAQADMRGVKVDGKTPAAYAAEHIGTAWAVVIGIDDYQNPNVRDLHYAVADAKAVAATLEKQGYQVLALYNEKATRRAIESELRTKLPDKVGEQDRVLIFYAGHGQDHKVRSGKALGYLLPYDSDHDDVPATGISMSTVQELADALPAKHVLFLLDVCFGGIAGTVHRGQPPAVTEAYLKQITRERGRHVITAGEADQEVIEAPQWGHSVFTYFLLKGLDEGLADQDDNGIITTHELYSYLEPRVFAEAQLRRHVQKPQLAELSGEKGQFVFFTKSGDNLAPPIASTTTGDDTAKLRAELEALKAQINQPKPEPPKPIEVAKAPAYDVSRQQQRQITGKDGAPMVLVPEGDFLYGENNKRLSLPGFYIDQFEVTASRYADFVKDTKRHQPRDWEEIIRSDNANRPIVRVTWSDADAYCRHHGRRLPTEQEWEKAAKGTDRRKYPWGNDEPKRALSNFDSNGNRLWEGYSTLMPVDSNEEGRSPYGIYNMAGNVWEWTSSDYESNPGPKVLRGGAWNSYGSDLRVTYRDYRAITNSLNDVGFRCAQDENVDKGSSVMQLAKAPPSYDLSGLIRPDITMKAVDDVMMVAVPEGEFTRGGAYSAHRVFLDRFLIDIYEVTVSRYARFLQAIGRSHPQMWDQQNTPRNGSVPVVGVTWNDANAYCQWVGKRLPTEAEWEKSARGTDGRRYPWGNEQPNPNLAAYDWWYHTKTGERGSIQPVGSYEAGKSPYGIYDLAGNVYEWVADWYSEEYTSSERNPKGPEAGQYKVLRGGSFNSQPHDVNSVDRVERHSPTSSDRRFGFRCAKTP